MKAGYVAIIGKPNVGKSTLLNRLIATKLSIVSAKPQTTRQRVLGVLTEGDYQCYFIDTPGILAPAYELQKRMLLEIKNSLKDADIVIWVIDPWFKTANSAEAMAGIEINRSWICAINKIDLVAPLTILPLIDRLRVHQMSDIIPLSALTGQNIDALKRTIFKKLPENRFVYPEEYISDRPERFFVAEIIREQIYHLYAEEIPYSTCVIIDEYKEREQAKDFIRAIIYVERDSQKGIIVGKQGKTLKKVGTISRKAIEAFTGRTVYLELWVKVKENWRKNKEFLKELGF
ncbi:GTPase Era [candidate division WOR-3 bacterium RBG_13_43_14]|uniref:GTPase Era n=1 Tax=candidate division WOR-3 bacterium RBG_13_43_14 TaxID=1802590 RepID=A0A1F4UB64_UNCW3|nr:MAG: GTPase Era [candidate division WOR-3 bacterium RBG_13_43_14]